MSKATMIQLSLTNYHRPPDEPLSRSNCQRLGRRVLSVAYRTPANSDRKRGALTILVPWCSPRGSRCRRSPVTK